MGIRELVLGDKAKDKETLEAIELKQREIRRLRDEFQNLSHTFKEKVAIFPGDVAEYEKFIKYNVEIVDLNPQYPDKRMFYESVFDFPYNSYRMHIEKDMDILDETIRSIKTRVTSLEKILDSGIEAIVNLAYLPKGTVTYGHGTLHAEVCGLPVRKVKDD